MIRQVDPMAVPAILRSQARRNFPEYFDHSDVLQRRMAQHQFEFLRSQICLQRFQRAYEVADIRLMRAIRNLLQNSQLRCGDFGMRSGGCRGNGYQRLCNRLPKVSCGRIGIGVHVPQEY